MTITRVIFDVKDGAIAFKMLDLFHSGVPFTLKEISDETAIPYKSVERRVRRMKSFDLIKNQRLGRRWYWDLSGLTQTGISIDPKKAFSIVIGKKYPAYLKIVAPQEAPQEAPQTVKKVGDLNIAMNSVTPHETPQEAPQEAPHETPQMPNINYNNTNTNNSKNNINILFASNPNEMNFNSSREGKGMSISGPESSFKETLQEIAAATPIKKRRALTPDNSTPQARLRQKKEEKDVSDYNVTDMRFEYESLWFEKKWKGFPSRWTMKDSKHIRELLDEQGGKNTVQYFAYVINNWEDIQRRYRIQGSPSAAILWSFRSSLLHEALNKGKVTLSRTLEYAGDENLPAGNGRF